MHKITIDFKSKTKSLVIENVTAAVVDPNARCISIAVETRNAITKYLIPFEQINFVEDEMSKDLIKVPPGVIQVAN